MRSLKQLIGVALLLAFSGGANAFFFIFPIPNLAKPSALQTIIDALEKSSETRALAFVAENKSFGSKFWVWGKHSGEISQEEANQVALEQCERNLRNAKAQSVGGQALYDFGDNKCELHPFTPNEGPKKAESKRKAAQEERERIAAIEEAKKVAAEEERKKIAAEEEKKRQQIEEEGKRKAEEETAKRIADEQERAASMAAQKQGKKSSKNAKSMSTNQDHAKTSAATDATNVDFDAEALKASKILGCKPLSAKVSGAKAGNILYKVSCGNRDPLLLSCDQSGLCLQI